jgi:hypothetical protein
MRTDDSRLIDNSADTGQAGEYCHLRNRHLVLVDAIIRWAGCLPPLDLEWAPASPRWQNKLGTPRRLSGLRQVLSCRPHIRSGRNGGSRITYSFAMRPSSTNAMSVPVTPEHPNTNRSRRNLARLLVACDRASEALPLGQAALTAHESVLGRDHAWTQDSVRVTAAALDALARAEEAAALRERYLTEA